MADTFKLKTKVGIGTTAVSIYTVPTTVPATTTVIIGLLLANTHSATIKGTVQIVTNSTTGDNADNPNILKAIPIPLASTFELMAGNKLVLQEGDILKVTSDITSSIDASLSIMEMS
jgi:hypothetical protein